MVKNYTRWHVVYIETIPQRNVHFLPSANDSTGRQLCLKVLICRDDTKVSFCLLFAVWHEASDKTVPVIGPPVLLCQAKSFLHLSRPELVFEEDGEKRARLLLSWTSSHNCFVRSCDSCCFDLFSPHGFFIKPVIGIVHPSYVTVALFQLFVVTVTVGAWCLDNLHSTKS